MKNKSCSLCLLNIFLFFWLINADSVYQQKIIIDTNLHLTQTLAISPYDSSTQLIVGSKTGILRVYNFENGNLIQQINDHKNEILSILWENNKEGLVTISVDRINNHSLAILHNKSFEQTFRWHYDEMIISASSTSDQTSSYVGFNFQSRIQEFHLRTKKNTVIYGSSISRRFTQIVYSSDYYYLYAIEKGQHLWVMKCGRSYGAYFYGFNQNIINLFTDQYSHSNYPAVFKLEKSGYIIIDPLGHNYNNSFPTQNINQFVFCPSDYVLGLTNNQTINIYSRDYRFTLIDSISLFADNKIEILALRCKQQNVFVTTRNNQIYVFSLKKDDQSKFWIYFLVIASILLIIMLVIIVKVIKNKKNQKNSQKTEENLIDYQKMTNNQQIQTS